MHAVSISGQFTALGIGEEAEEEGDDSEELFVFDTMLMKELGEANVIQSLKKWTGVTHIVRGRKTVYTKDVSRLVNFLM